MIAREKFIYVPNFSDMIDSLIKFQPAWLKAFEFCP